MELMAEPSDTRTHIIDVAQELFAEKGYDATSVRDICTSAKVNIAAVNYHFGDKEHLYIEAVKHAHSCSMSGSAMDDSFQKLAPKARLEAFIREVVKRMHVPAQPSAMKLLMREMADPGKASHIIVQEFIQPMAFLLRSIVQELLPNANPAKILMLGFSIIGQILYYRQNRPVSELIFSKAEMEQLSAEMVADHIVDFTFAAMGLRRTKTKISNKQ